jgi:predicted NBD/HSP70 family sugar kinase
MLACQHGGKARRAEPLSAFWAVAPTRLIATIAEGQRSLMDGKILVVDIGGTHVKLLTSGRDQREFASGPRMRPKQLIAKFKERVRGWKFDRVSIGFPAPVRKGRITKNPKHLGKGWVGFNFARALGIPVRLINDAAMQALGSYHGGRMLFLGLGTGLGSALVWDKTLMSLELGDLPYADGKIIENYLGVPGLALLGGKKWKREVTYAVTQLKKSFIADYVVLGGGLVHRFAKLPPGIERGRNENAFVGGIRLWQTDPRTRRPKWRVM